MPSNEQTYELYTALLTLRLIVEGDLFNLNAIDLKEPLLANPLDISSRSASVNTNFERDLFLG